MKTGYLKNQDGAAAVEFSLIAPVLITLIVGLIDIGIYVKNRMKLEQMSRAAVDYVLQGGSEDNIQTDVIAFYDPSDIDSYTLTTERVCTCSDGLAQDCASVSCETGDHSRQYFQVSLERTYTPFISYPGIPDELELAGNARMRLD